MSKFDKGWAEINQTPLERFRAEQAFKSEDVIYPYGPKLTNKKRAGVMLRAAACIKTMFKKVSTT